MATAGNDAADHRNAESDPPLTAELLADLQAGVLDALNRVRREVAALGADPASPPDPPPGAALAAIGVGTVALLRTPAPAPSTPTDIEHITVSTPPMQIPLSRAEILGLLDRSPDFGPLSDPAAWATRRPRRCWGRVRSPSTPAPAWSW